MVTNLEETYVVDLLQIPDVNRLNQCDWFLAKKFVLETSGVYVSLLTMFGD
jgi:hypothetical protein